MNRFDEKRIYCRKLGHHLDFSYCRTVNNKLPCSRILDCWFTVIPVQEWLDEQYSAEEKSRIFKPSAPKISSILDIVAKVKSQAEA